MARPQRKRRFGKSRMRKKVSILSKENIKYVDYKDVNLLRRFITDRAKIRAKYVTGNSEQQQREVAIAIKNAREMALLPYENRITTQRRGPMGGRGHDMESEDHAGHAGAEDSTGAGTRPQDEAGPDTQGDPGPQVATTEPVDTAPVAQPPNEDISTPTAESATTATATTTPPPSENTATTAEPVDTATPPQRNKPGHENYFALRR